MNDLEKYADVFQGIQPWSGVVPPGFLIDFLGTLTSGRFREWTGLDTAGLVGGPATTRLPTIEDGEGWFEMVNWVEAARDARDKYVMVTLGACYAGQAIGAYKALQALNPMPCRLVAVEPEPENCQWIRLNMHHNGIGLDEYWLVPMAISDKNDPVLFPVGSPGTGVQNCVSTNETRSREIYANEIIAAGGAADVLRKLLVHNTTGITMRLVESESYMGEIKLVSAVTLGDVLGPFDFVDYLECDIQQSEIVVIPPFIDLLKRKVRRILIGTHGKDVHATLHRLFEQHGWDIIFSYAPNSSYTTPLGNFVMNDGVLTVKNPDL
jgi:FkbM family methyltransferase